MRLSSLCLAALLVLSAGLLAVGQDGPPPRHDEPPHEMDKPDRPDRPRWGRDRGEPMSEQRVREALDVLRMIDPDKAAKLEKHLDEKPERIGHALRENFPHLARFMAMRRYDPDGFDLRIKDLRLSRQSQLCARRLHEATEAGDDALAAAELLVLEGLVAEHFDVRQQIREHELAKLESQIQELRQQLEDRADNRDDLIAERVDEFIDHDKPDRW